MLKIAKKPLEPNMKKQAQTIRNDRKNNRMIGNWGQYRSRSKRWNRKIKQQNDERSKQKAKNIC